MDRFRIVAVILDEQSVATRDPMIAREREQAIYDLLAQNEFRPFNSPGGPYRLILSVREGRLVFRGEPLEQVLATLARYHGVRLTVGSPQVAAMRVSGSFSFSTHAASSRPPVAAHDGWMTPPWPSGTSRNPE